MSFDPNNIRYEFTFNSDSSSSGGVSGSGGISMWMVGAAAGGGLLVFIMLVVLRRRQNQTDNGAFVLKAGAGARQSVEEWVNPLVGKGRRDLAFDNPIYDYLDSVA